MCCDDVLLWRVRAAFRFSPTYTAVQRTDICCCFLLSPSSSALLLARARACLHNSVSAPLRRELFPCYEPTPSQLFPVPTARVFSPHQHCFLCTMRLGGIVVATCLAAAAAAGEGEYTISSKDKAFNDWFHEITKEFGTDANAVEIRTTTDMGRGVYALDTISEETPLLKIPRDYIVSVDTVESSASAMVYERIERSSDKLALFILEQKAKGDSSKFKPWIDVMPREFGSPLFGTPQELERLKGDPIHQEVLQELKAWEQQYDLLSASILEKFPEVFPSGCCSFEEYKWARHMIESRAWHLRGRQYLAPMADFFNHQTLPSMTYDTEPDEVICVFCCFWGFVKLCL